MISDIPVFEITVVLVWSQSFKFHFLFSIHNRFSFSLYMLFLRSLQLGSFTVFSSFQFRFSVNSNELVSLIKLDILSQNQDSYAHTCFFCNYTKHIQSKQETGSQTS